jgi:adenylate cyclase
VLNGSIMRGSGEAIRAVIWVSDLRGFTDLTDRLTGPQVTLLLNAYFEALAGAVLEQGGEVPQFVGDGLLAVFPLSPGHAGGRHGDCLHEGEIFFGNVGAADRLDLTVIGRAVNETSRVEALCKNLKRRILVTEPVARRLDVPWEDLGRHPLRGVAEPVTILSPIQSSSAT